MNNGICTKDRTNDIKCECLNDFKGKFCQLHRPYEFNVDSKNKDNNIIDKRLILYYKNKLTFLDPQKLRIGYGFRL